MMPFALIRVSDNKWLAGPLDDTPDAVDGERVVEVAIGYGTTCDWHPLTGGFVDLIPVATPVTVVQLYTDAEFAALWTLAGTDGRIAKLLAIALASPSIDFASPAFAAGLAISVAAGVLTAARAARIAAGLPPLT